MPEWSKINGEQVGIGRARAQLSQPQKPAYFNAHEWPKGLAPVQIGSTRFGKIGCQFGIACMMMPMGAPAIRPAPINAATSEGSSNTPLPIMEVNVSATKLQRPG
jgi:hypothetical protein